MPPLVLPVFWFVQICPKILAYWAALTKGVLLLSNSREMPPESSEPLHMLEKRLFGDLEILLFLEDQLVVETVLRGPPQILTDVLPCFFHLVRSRNVLELKIFVYLGPP